MKLNEQQWHQALPGEWGHSNEVHVWRVSLDVSASHAQNLLRVLSADEAERAGRFRFESDRKRFITARGMLRQILGWYLGERPHQLRFGYTAYGKPVLATDPGSDALCFNVSHAGAFALYAVARGRNVGIDIERIRDNIAVGQIARRFFAPGEINSLERIDENKRYELFFQYWTRKEAFIKVTGEGMSFPLEQFDVSSINGTGFSPVSLQSGKTEPARWYVQDLFPCRGYAAAIAVEGGDSDLACRHYAG